ncbi:HU family DNA-binding protein [Ruixingdingia sedimenti]|uniref:HU family DNA-binding protein n=1 Tax=Ruixingdingia sedimenti TaxID=3073604 RepID=A0ABU1FED4_9RHOB|nr:HU family DNA-binding protein [Xinfangfangia sp. LG-4]MDR5655226.1 HU family DNA-binding protein [Xinfangfangia sp. LG-4]
MSKTVSKSDLARAVAEEMGWNITVTTRAVDALFARIKAEAEAGNSVNIAGFGRFREKVRAARTARNPQTGAPVEVAESRAVSFKPAKPKS